MNSEQHTSPQANNIHSLYDKATTDAVTRLYNRHHFLELAKREYCRAERLQTPISILLIEIEHFKEINDRHGHLAGDQALRCLADCLMENTREIDIHGRYGRDEFAVLLTDADRSDALSIALRILCSIDSNQHDNNHTKRLFDINIGIGHSLCPTSDSTINQLIRQAEQALYIAKIDACNRVHLSRAY